MSAIPVPCSKCGDLIHAAGMKAHQRGGRCAVRMAVRKHDAAGRLPVHPRNEVLLKAARVPFVRDLGHWRQGVRDADCTTEVWLYVSPAVHWLIHVFYLSELPWPGQLQCLALLNNAEFYAALRVVAYMRTNAADAPGFDVIIQNLITQYQDPKKDQ